MAALQRRVHVLVIPFPTAGHMLPLLDLAHLLSVRFGHAVTVAVTPENLSSVPARSTAIAPLVVPLPADAETSAKALSMKRLMCALDGLRAPLLSWARSRSDDPPTAIISDFFCGWTESLAAELGVPRLVFCPSGALCLAILHSLWRRMPKASDPDELLAFPDIPRSPVYRWRQISSLYRLYEEGDLLSEFVKTSFLANIKSWAFVFNSFSDLEKTYLDHLKADLGHRRVWAVGPLAPAGTGQSAAEEEEKVAAWLDGCAEGTVVYAAFGSLWVLSPAQARALAAALERCGARFVWATRGVVELPEGFEERVAGRGMVIRGWAPQVAILNHPAVGAFVTHCGWNSILEAAAAGVALLAWPMTADQFYNAGLMEEAGTAVRACDGGPDSVPDAEELARVVAEAVGEEGWERREKARELGKRAVAAVGKGGSSARDLAEMVEELSQLARP